MVEGIEAVIKSSIVSGESRLLGSWIRHPTTTTYSRLTAIVPTDWLAETRKSADFGFGLCLLRRRSYRQSRVYTDFFTKSTKWYILVHIFTPIMILVHSLKEHITLLELV
jgi:hypothetical protein